MSNTSTNSIDLTAKPLVTMSGHEDAVLGIAYLPGRKQVVTCSGDGTIRIWDAESGEQEGTSMEHGGWIEGIAMTRDGKRILACSQENEMRVWDVETHELIEEWENHTGGILSCIAMSPDDQLVASGDDSGEIGGELSLGPIKGHEHIVTSVLWSLDGTQLFSASFDHSIRCWNSDTGESIGEPWTGHTDNHCGNKKLARRQLY
ncbi:hypothetical protein PAXINDRAFT_83737 [Paxillus involutus ATCC 200175]|uniref:WD40 repeat-like protein n=1 Tax=Paxillus involutus ATCC 200175 TaxID=664439 RepID=A0A0C9ST89_PAXIN|nr:hypothetical protein PAXINDRAFT_83737 [Paxillus involutus ATCC 200175]